MNLMFRKNKRKIFSLYLFFVTSHFGNIVFLAYTKMKKKMIVLYCTVLYSAFSLQNVLFFPNLKIVCSLLENPLISR